jgi:23S rRNA (pseudouridine1915-N3)-methyltransferase
MKILLLLTGKTTDTWVQNGLAEYEKRLKHYADFSVAVLPDIKAGKLSADQLKKLEGDAMLQFLESNDYLVLLDEGGKMHNSRQFSNQLQKWMNAGPKRLVFVVGGAYGFSEEVKARANGTLSLSPMTFTHQMVRPFFVEQLYRAFTILKGEKYHND